MAARHWHTQPAPRFTPADWADLIHGSHQDTAYIARSLIRSPGFTVAVVLTLALGLGANAAIFSFLDQVFLRAPAGVESPGTVRRVWEQQPARNSTVPHTWSTLSYHEYRAVAAGLADLAHLALYSAPASARVGRDNGARAATVVYASSSYFSTLGARPAIGRTFTDAEADVHGASRVVVVSHAYWRAYLGADAGAIGKTLTINDNDYTIIGVAAPHFSGIDLQETDLWLPLGMFPTRETSRVSFWDSSVVRFFVFARVARGVNDAVLESRATAAYRATPTTDFAVTDGAQLFFRPIHAARGMAAAPKEVSIAVRLAIVALITLLITSANVANLLLARSVARRREVAVRLALGISRVRLARLFVIESALLSCAAGVSAVLATVITGGVLRSLLLPGVRFAGGSIGWQVVAFTGVLSVFAGIVAGLAPAIQASRTDLSGALKGGSRMSVAGRSFTPRILVGAQTALSVLLLVGAALCVDSLRHVERLHIGFDVPRLAFASVVLPAGEMADTLGFSSTMRDVGLRVRGLPGVEAVAFARDEPMTGYGRVRFYTATDSSEGADRIDPTANTVSAEYFATVGVSFVRGATFSDRDPNAASGVVVNQTLARTYWPNVDPVGQCLHLQQRDAPCLTVVGVVEDAIRLQLIETPTPQLFLPIFRSIRGQRPPNVMIIRADPRRLDLVMAAAAHALHNVYPRGEPRVARMADRLAPLYRPWILGAALFDVFGALALIVAALGIYSSVSYSVMQRAHETGVRIALGASATDVVSDVIRRGVQPVVAGGVAGAILTLAAAPIIRSLLYAVQPRNPAIIALVVLGLVAVGMIAASLPALRATRIDPIRALAAE